MYVHKSQTLYWLSLNRAWHLLGLSYGRRLRPHISDHPPTLLWENLQQMTKTLGGISHQRQQKLRVIFPLTFILFVTFTVL